MSQETIKISVRTPLLKVALLVLVIIAGAWSYFVVRWYLGNTLAEYFNTDLNSLGIAQRAVGLAPNDPLTHWRIAQVSERALPLDQQAQAIAEYRKAVALSPNDYRFWMSLGIAYEQAGDNENAEHALRRAVALAPAYVYPHWYLGNLFVRTGRYDDAFAELRIASQADPQFLSQLFRFNWEINSDDPQAQRNALGANSNWRAQFAVYLVERKQADKGVAFWNAMSPDEKRANQASGQALIASLSKEFRYHDALKVWNEIANDNSRTEVGRVFDGSFEENVNYGPDQPFGWQVKSVPQVEIGIDPNRNHGGSRSLRFVFQVRSVADTAMVSQLVTVQPQTEYEFECYLSTDNLQSGGTPQVEIVDPVTNKPIVTSKPAPTGTTMWNRVNLSFKTNENVEAVILRIVRVSCVTEETPVCPIFGSVWYDDFSIKRAN